MKEKQLISIIIPSYNRANLVGEAIDSILAQKVDADIEIVIGDDCSTDNTREVLQSYYERYPDIIRIFFREQNLGLGANWAQCVKDCRGDFICNCDNDDYWHNPHKLQIQLDYMLSHPGCNICITDHRTHNRKTGEILEFKAVINRDIDIQEVMWRGGGLICNATIMYRAAFLKTHLDLDEFIRRRLSLQDWPAWVILTAYTDIDVLPVSTATLGIETDSITRPDSIRRLEDRFNKDKEVYRYLCELFPDKFPYDEISWKRYVAGRLMSIAFKARDFDNARLYGSQNPAGVTGLKRLCSQNRLLFWLFVKIGQIKRPRHKNT